MKGKEVWLRELFGAGVDMCRLALVALCGWLNLAVGGWAATPSELVQKLGDPSFEVRESATKELEKLGRSAQAALEEGLKSDDPEIYSRCFRLLKLATRSDLELRLTTFARDITGKSDAALPGWSRFRDMVGNDVASRELFVNMYRGNSNLLPLIEKDPAAASRELYNRTMKIQQQLYSVGPNGQRLMPNTGEILMLIFAASDERLTGEPNPLQGLLMMFYQPQLMPLIRTDEGVRQIVTAALRSPRNLSDPNVLVQAINIQRYFQFPDNLDVVFHKAARELVNKAIKQEVPINFLMGTMNLAQTLELVEGADLGIKVAKTKAVNAWTRAWAMTIVARHGKLTHLPVLEELMEDKTLLGQMGINNVTLRSELRDVALGVAIYLTNQKPEDYGFPFFKSANANGGNPPPFNNSPNVYGFSNDQERSAAFLKWRTWRAKEAKK